jgi:hypothetical protein
MFPDSVIETSLDFDNGIESVMNGAKEISWLIAVTDDEHFRLGNKPSEFLNLVFASLHACS